MPKHKKIILFATLLTGTSHAYDCTNVPQYSDSASYAKGDITQNGTTAYRCNVGGWCSHGGPYTPGKGWATSEAWTELGTCKGGTSDSSSLGESVSGTSPKPGREVNGKHGV